MSDILSSVLTFPVRIILILTVIILIGLWIVSIVWVNRDAKTREAPVTLWTAVAIVPVAGLVAYCLLLSLIHISSRSFLVSSAPCSS